MQFQQAAKMVRDTSTDVLCEAWGVGPDHVQQRREAPHEMTIQEAGSLAAVHGLLLPDVFAV